MNKSPTYVPGKFKSVGRPPLPNLEECVKNNKNSPVNELKSNKNINTLKNKILETCPELNKNKNIDIEELINKFIEKKEKKIINMK